MSLGQLKVMSAIESCRTAALGGHVARCENDACGHTHVATNLLRTIESPLDRLTLPEFNVKKEPEPVE